MKVKLVGFIFDQLELGLAGVPEKDLAMQLVQRILHNPEFVTTPCDIVVRQDVVVI